MLAMSQSPIKQTDFLFLQGNLEGYQSASDPNPRRLDDLEGNPGARSSAASSFLKCMIAVDRDALTQEDWLERDGISFDSLSF